MENKRKLRSIRAFSRYEVISTGVGSVVLWVLPVLPAASASSSAWWWRASPFTGGDTGGGEICWKASSRPLAKTRATTYSPKALQGPTAPSEAGHSLSLSAGVGTGAELQGAIRGVFELACTLSFSQTSGICVVQGEAQDEEPCQLTVTIHCLNGIMSPLTWRRPRPLCSDIAT